MCGNSIGKRFSITFFGESHGKCIGVVIDGCPPGIKMNEKIIQTELEKRKPQLPENSTPRVERDEIQLISGTFKEYTTGAPIAMMVWNRDINSSPYEEYQWKPRPGHADYPARIRYRGFNDYRGGGRFSGRLTAATVMAGAVAKSFLQTKGVEVLAYTIEIAGIKARTDLTLKQIRDDTYTNVVRCPDLLAATSMLEAVSAARNEGDSVGGIIECVVINVPVGLGEPIFDALDTDLAKILFSIPAVKGVEFGAGFQVSRLRGSENNDLYQFSNGKIVTKKNNSGGILGGLSNGMPIVMRVALKPTPSIALEQKTVDLRTMSETGIKIKGRHDACIVPRAVPVVEASVALVLADHMLQSSL